MLLFIVHAILLPRCWRPSCVNPGSSFQSLCLLLVQRFRIGSRGCHGIRLVHPRLQRSVTQTINPLAYSILLPIVWKLGEDFARLWIGPNILAILMVVVVCSLAFGRPFSADSVPPPWDERHVPMHNAVARQFTMMLGVIFVVIFASNLVVALLRLEFGTLYVALNFLRNP